MSIDPSVSPALSHSLHLAVAEADSFPSLKGSLRNTLSKGFNNVEKLTLLLTKKWAECTPELPLQRRGSGSPTISESKKYFFVGLPIGSNLLR